MIINDQLALLWWSFWEGSLFPPLGFIFFHVLNIFLLSFLIPKTNEERQIIHGWELEFTLVHLFENLLDPPSHMFYNNNKIN